MWDQTIRQWQSKTKQLLLQKSATEKRCHAIRQLADGITISFVLIIVQQDLIRA